MSGTLHEHAGRAMLRFERRLTHPIEKVWRAVTDPAELVHWFPAAVEYQPQPGADITFTFEGQEPGEPDGQVVEFDPPRVFAFLWGGELMRFELAPDGADCRLIFTHEFDDRPGAASFATGWTFCLNALEMLLASRPIEVPGGWDGMHDQHEAYIDAFGLGAGTVETTSEGWQVRFERQLTRPTADVWDGLLAISSAGQAPSVGLEPPTAFVAANVEPGEIVALEAPKLLEYAWLRDSGPAGSVRWEFSDGPGGAARLALTLSGPPELAGEQEAALAAWQEHIARLAGQRQRAAR